MYVKPGKKKDPFLTNGQSPSNFFRPDLGNTLGASNKH